MAQVNRLRNAAAASGWHTDGFWAVLRRLGSPSQSSLVLLSAKRDGARLRCVERFRVDNGGATGSQAEGNGLLELEWAEDDDGLQELVRTTAATDVTLRLRSPRGPASRAPGWSAVRVSTEL